MESEREEKERRKVALLEREQELLGCTKYPSCILKVSIQVPLPVSFRCLWSK
jgi:hypothetical protein